MTLSLSSLFLPSCVPWEMTCLLLRAILRRLMLALLMLQAKTQVQEVIDVDGGETRMQSAVEAGLSEASRRHSSQQGTTSSASPAKEASEPQQQFQPSSLGEQSGLQSTSDEQLQAAIKELRSQRHDPNHDDSESSNGSKQRETSAVASDGPNKGQK